MRGLSSHRFCWMIEEAPRFRQVSDNLVSPLTGVDFKYSVTQRRRQVPRFDSAGNSQTTRMALVSPELASGGN